MSVRAKFVCQSVEMHSMAPSTYTGQQYDAAGKIVNVELRRWSRKYRFGAQYDTSIPEDQRYALATPWASLEMTVDNPAVSFEPGKSYYLDFAEVPAEPAA